MIIYAMKEFQVPISMQCDKCGVKVTQEDHVEWQEFFTYEDTGGFGSVFGDETKVSIELCQKCFKELLGPYIKLEPPEWPGEPKAV